MCTHVARSAISDLTSCLQALLTTANTISVKNAHSADSNMLTYETINES